MKPHFDQVAQRWVGLPDCTTIEDEWLCIVTDIGMRILSFGDVYQAGGSVHVISDRGREVTSYDKLEWHDEPEQVMGAMLRAAAGLYYDDGGGEEESRYIIDIETSGFDQRFFENNFATLLDKKTGKTTDIDLSEKEKNK